MTGIDQYAVRLHARYRGRVSQQAAVEYNDDIGFLDRGAGADRLVGGRQPDEGTNDRALLFGAVGGKVRTVHIHSQNGRGGDDFACDVGT